MSVLLQAIEFNHDLTSAASDALTIRRNAVQGVEVPEWVFGRNVEPEDSPVAYSIRETRGNTITIRANFDRTDPGLGRIEVRAIPAPFPRFPASYLQLLLQPLLIWPAYYFAVYQYLSQLMIPSAGSILGEVRQRTIEFGVDGQSGFQTFALEGVRLGIDGIAARDVHWLWQYRENPLDAWQDMNVSSHRVFALLETPKAPWLQQPPLLQITQLPWVDVLDVACTWAERAVSLDEAAGRITYAINSLGYRPGPELGHKVLEYGCEILALPQYSFPYFNCTKFLARVKGGIGNGPFVNCSDCATILTTFANALGCDLWQSKMGDQLDGFKLNHILPIGFNRWSHACGWDFFTYHEVAWTGACTEQDNIYDACLHLNGNAPRIDRPFYPLLPINMNFGLPGIGDYRRRIAAPTIQAQRDCSAEPHTRQRRFIV